MTEDTPACSKEQASVGAIGSACSALKATGMDDLRKTNRSVLDPAEPLQDEMAAVSVADWHPIVAVVVHSDANPFGIGRERL